MRSPETADLVARDTALPLATLLDDHALASWLATPGAEPPVVRRTYLRYKPGTSCVVLAEMSTPTGTRQVVVTGVGPASRDKLAKTLLKARDGEIVAAEPDAGMVATTPAADRQLPALRRLLTRPGRAVRALVRDESRVTALTPLAYKPHRRWVGRADRDDAAPVVVRVYRRQHAHRHLQVLPELIGLPAPRLLGGPVRDAVAMTWADGDVLAEMLAAGSTPVAALRGVGRLLARLHAVPAVDAPRAAAPDLGAASAAVGYLAPALRTRAEDLAERIRARLDDPGPAVLAHGDLSADQVVVGADGAALLDLDRAGCAPAALDLGCLAATLAIDVGTDAPAVLAAVLDGYGDGADVPREDRVAAFAAAALLARAVEPFRRADPCWAVPLQRRLVLAESVLEDGLGALPHADAEAGAA